MDIIEIGLMFDNTDPENVVQLEGWHVNSMQPIPGAEAFLVTPANPKFGVLGQPLDAVYRYVFNSKEHFSSLILNSVID